MRFAVSVLAINWMKCHSRHTAFIVAAANEDEAAGKGLRIGRKLYPERECWYQHDVVVVPTDAEPAEVENSYLKSQP